MREYAHLCLYTRWIRSRALLRRNRSEKFLEVTLVLDLKASHLTLNLTQCHASAFGQVYSTSMRARRAPRVSGEVILTAVRPPTIPVQH